MSQLWFQEFQLHRNSQKIYEWFPLLAQLHATRPSKIESILKLSSTLSSEKLFCVRKISSSLNKPSIMTAQTQRNEQLENFRTYTENLVNKNKTKHQTIEHINKGTKKISNHKKKSSAYHGAMSNNFSQYCEKRTHQVAIIVLRFSPKCDGTNQPAFVPLNKGSLYKDPS